MKKVIQLDPNAAVTTSQKIASALNGLSNAIYEAQASFVRELDLSLFNRGNGVWLQTTSTAQIGKAGWTDEKKGDGYIYRSNNTTPHAYLLTEKLSKTEWSIIIVGQRNIDKSSSEFANINSQQTENDFIVRLGITSNGQYTLWKGVATPRISTATEFPDNPHIYTITFSVSEGLKLYIDGVLKAENKEDKHPLTNSVVRFAASNTTGWGHYICVNADLSKVEHAAKLKIVHDALKEHYQL